MSLHRNRQNGRFFISYYDIFFSLVHSFLLLRSSFRTRPCCLPAENFWIKPRCIAVSQENIAVTRSYFCIDLFTLMEMAAYLIACQLHL